MENLTLQGRNLFPNLVEIDASNSMKFSPYNTTSDSGRHEFKLTLKQIQADMRDVAFYYRKKTGIPKLADSGLADVLLGGGGLTVCLCRFLSSVLFSWQLGYGGPYLCG